MSKVIRRTPSLLSVPILSITPAASFAAGPDQRTVLTIPLEDHEDILPGMRGNLDQVRQVIETLDRQDFDATNASPTS